MRQEGATVLERDFYGAVRISVERDEISGEVQRKMTHGNTVHGAQFVDAARAQIPTSYFGRASGVGLLIDGLRKREPETSLRIGVVGLGVGTLAAYAESEDTLRFYEISALVADLAESHFSFLARARDRGARVEVVVGDGRIVLEREIAGGDRGGYDLLVVDAFSSGAIPVHLLTAECAALYAGHLAPGGVIALHISNVHLDLAPVAAGIAADRGMHFRRVTTASDSDDGTLVAKWILLSDDQAILDGVAPTDERSNVARMPEPLVWTDDYSSLFSVLR